MSMNEMNDLNELTALTKSFIDKANQIYGRTFSVPTVSFGLRGGVAGTANYGYNLIRYNHELYTRNKDDFKARTVPHEVAHLVARTMYGNIKPHGREWRSVMHRLGVQEVTRCHSYDVNGVKSARSRPFVYACGCQEFKLTSTIHRRILMGQTRTCLKCRKKIVFQRTER
jgi:SprT protein